MNTKNSNAITMILLVALATVSTAQAQTELVYDKNGSAIVVDGPGESPTLNKPFQVERVPGWRYDANKSGGEVVDLLVLVSNQRGANMGVDVEAITEDAVSTMNEGLSQSLVSHSVNLVAVVPIDIDESLTDDRCAYLINLSRSSEQVTFLMRLYGADYVLLSREGLYSCAVIGPSETLPFGVFGPPEILGNAVVAHESGHIFGLLHNVEESPQGTSNHGFYWTNGIDRGRTLMSYRNHCEGSCPRVNYYSSIELSSAGGTMMGIPGVADSVPHLMVNMPIVAGFGESVPSVSLGDGDIFQVTVAWTDYLGEEGFGREVPGGSQESVNLWFFDPDNWEMLIKILDGCGINNHYWVLFAATTSVEFKVTVTHVPTGAQRVYTNPLWNPANAVIDTSAIACS